MIDDDEIVVEKVGVLAVLHMFQRRAVQLLLDRFPVGIDHEIFLWQKEKKRKQIQFPLGSTVVIEATEEGEYLDGRRYDQFAVGSGGGVVQDVHLERYRLFDVPGQRPTGRQADVVHTEEVAAVGVSAAPRAVREEGVDVGQVVQFQTRCVEGVAVLPLAEHGARLPRSIWSPNAHVTIGYHCPSAFFHISGGWAWIKTYICLYLFHR